MTFPTKVETGYSKNSQKNKDKAKTSPHHLLPSPPSLRRIPLPQLKPNSVTNRPTHPRESIASGRVGKSFSKPSPVHFGLELKRPVVALQV
jgi:hypothetical protein